MGAERLVWIVCIVLYGFTQSAENVLVSGIIDQPTTLQCDLPKSDPPNILWRDWIYNMDRNPATIYGEGAINDKHTEKANYEVDPETFALTIKKVAIDDAGDIFCESVINDTTTLKQVYELSPTEAPMCEGAVELEEGGSNTKLTCKARYSGSIPTLEWYHGDEALEQLDLSVINLAEVSIDLEADPKWDQQEFVCKMDHLGKMAECKMNLDVKYLVRDLEIKPMKNNVRVNDKITCMARGNPAPKVELNPGGAMGDGSASITVGADWLGTVQEVSCTAGNSVSGTPQIMSKNTTYEVLAPKVTPKPEPEKTPKPPNPDNNKGEPEPEESAAAGVTPSSPSGMVLSLCLLALAGLYSVGSSGDTCEPARSADRAGNRHSDRSGSRGSHYYSRSLYQTETEVQETRT